MKPFISPRGDKFSNQSDAEIAERGIRSLIFTIDRKFPREHKLKIEWDTDEVNPTYYWIDKEGNLLNDEHKSIALDPVYYQLLSNLVLRHLYVITSGQLQQENDRGRLGLAESERLIEWKRAHYRFYQPGSVYTLGSEEAQEHARLIKQDYGIDIWEEIRRRREIGSLLPNQVMTFVRETQPDQAGYDAKPNELPFDPAWIPQRI